MTDKKIIIELSNIDEAVWLEFVLNDIKRICEQREHPIKIEIFVNF